jgi:hypothetical protein
MFEVWLGVLGDGGINPQILIELPVTKQIFDEIFSAELYFNLIKI